MFSRLLRFSSRMIEKPQNDHRLYRHVVLPNKMEAVAISDSSCDQASCTMACRVGSVFDPKDIPGLAHFLEHMLFLGTEKYPQEDSYHEYLAKHGGRSNAYTAGTQTVYYFSVAPESLDEAVDRFAQFFISPLFTQSATDREINAVNSEHAKNKQSDMWRMQQLLRNRVNPSHPLNRFSTGDIDTLKNIPEKLGINVREQLLNFHKKYYSANEMRLAVLGKGSLDEIEELIRSKFDQIVNKNVQIPRGDAIGLGEVPVLAKDFCTMTMVVPVRDTQSVSFQFVLPEQTENWESKPCRYFSHLLGHEGRGSLLSLLKDKSLAAELFAGSMMDEAGLCVFNVDIHLTEEGDTDDGIRQVGEALFAYIRMLKEHKVDKNIWDELQQLDEINFRLRSLPDPGCCSNLIATGLFDYPVEKVMSAPTKMWEYDPEGIDKLLLRLRTDNMWLTCVGKRFADVCTTKDQWYGTEHNVEKLREDWRSAWDKATVSGNDMFIPLPNPFLPKDLELRPIPNDGVPEKPALLHLPNCHVYYKQDATFKLPKCVLGFTIYSDFIAASCRNDIMAEVFFQCVMEELNEYAYDAEIAGLGYKLCTNGRGSVLEVAGYSDKVGTIMTAIAEKISALREIPEATWDIVHHRIARDLHNAATRRQPYMQASSYKRRLTNSPQYLFQERLEEFQKLRREDFIGLNEKLFEHRFCECLVQGNVTKDELSVLLTSKFFDLLPPVKTEPKEVSAVEVVKVDRDIHICMLGTNPEEKNSASIVTVQIGEDSIETSTLVNLATQILSQRYFDDLRTKQQFGYIVSQQASRNSGFMMEMNYIIQTEKPVWEATAKTNEFIMTNTKVLTEMADEDFETYRQALLTILEETPKTLRCEFAKHWSPICDRNFNFHRKEQQTAYLKKLTREDFNKFARSLDSCHRIVSEVCALEHWEHRPPGSLSTTAELREFMEKAPEKLRGFTKIQTQDEASSRMHG